MMNPQQSSLTRCGLVIILTAVAIVAADTASAQSDYQPSPENLQARREFQDMKFGMFIHWGVYSVLGDGEWVFHERRLQITGYLLFQNLWRMVSPRSQPASPFPLIIPTGNLHVSIHDKTKPFPWRL